MPPDSLGEPLADPLFISRHSLDHQQLPQTSSPSSNRRPSTAREPHHEAIPLQPLIPDNESAASTSESDIGESENDSLVPAGSSTQMKRASRRNKSKPRPALKVEIKDHEGNGHLNGHANGNADMSTGIELRRKHASNEDHQRAQMMSHSQFSLDHEPMPPTPQTPGMVTTSFSSLPPTDKRNFLLLCLLYFLQGIPMGLASGSVPFLLKNYLSYGQIGIFSLAIYPYSLKLLWSPIVDAVWSKRLGRRKSWILPIQTVSGFSMIYLGGQIDAMMEKAGADGGSGVWGFTGWWFLLVFLCATQDIAVDGWAISLLSMANISYASTAQTVGLTAGSFLSHTVFLALQAPDFANHWFRAVPKDVGLLTLGGYMEFWGWGYLVVTAGLAILKREEKTKESEGIMEVYRSMWQVIKLPNILTIVAIHLVSKLGFVTNEAVTNLKLLDKGFGQANLALVVLIDFPFELGLGYYAGKWSTEYTPLRLWCWAYVARLFAAVVAQITVLIYPTAHDEAVPFWYLLTVIISHVYSTFTSTIMFVASAAFHARIADPEIGGTYMTLLAT
jgi:MFS transporter, PAT family, solute carrier family 33 (acetyl-CoA transportor), member 1